MQMTTRAVFRPYIYRRPCALQVQAKTNIVLIKLNYETNKQIRRERERRDGVISWWENIGLESFQLGHLGCELDELQSES